MWTFGLSWELPEFRKESAIFTSSRAKLTAAFRSRKQSNVAEIYGLLHLVTAESDDYQHVLTNNVELDPTKRINLNDYTTGNEDLNWTAEMERLDKEFPIVVFSKVCFQLGRAQIISISPELTSPTTDVNRPSARVSLPQFVYSFRNSQPNFSVILYRLKISFHHTTCNPKPR